MKVSYWESLSNWIHFFISEKFLFYVFILGNSPCQEVAHDATSAFSILIVALKAIPFQLFIKIFSVHRKNGLYCDILIRVYMSFVHSYSPLPSLAPDQSSSIHNSLSPFCFHVKSSSCLRLPSTGILGMPTMPGIERQFNHAKILII